VAKAHIYNSACPVGIAQTAAAKALVQAETEPLEAIAEWQRRRDAICAELSNAYDVVPAAGGWSMLLDVSTLCHGSVEASRRLLEHGRIAATYMRDWGEENGDRFVRLVFSNEPLPRLTGLKARFDAAFR
ncbi:aspartate aminotransferase, partial [Rhizobiaceae sp. 2RAB30]